MKFIDLHCDTALRILEENQGLYKNNFEVDIEKLIKGNAKAQVFAHFIELNLVKDPFAEFMKMHSVLKKELDKNSDYIEVVTNIKELEETNNEGKIGAFLSIEEGEVLEGKIERVKEVYNLGIRFITLTWNFKNSIGHPNTNFEYQNQGLTKRGFEIVEEMEYQGIIPDCSHLSDQGFWDLVNICKKPFIATHSNARSITNHSRNLTDEMIKALANKGGVTGINFCAPFLGDNEVSQISDMVSHIKHLKNLGGIDIIALGTDYDGIGNKVEMKDISEIGLLGEALIKNGFKEEEVEKIYYKNVERIIKDCLK